MPPRSDHDCIALPGEEFGKVLVAGGRGPQGSVHRSAFVLDLATGRYEDVASMTSPRCNTLQALVVGIG